MKNLNKPYFLFLFIALVSLSFNLYTENGRASDEIITFYAVPLVCGAAPEIGCGSRIKPLFIETENVQQIKESWTNRKGTVLAFKWDDSMTDEKEREKIIQPLFTNNDISATLIKDNNKMTELLVSFRGNDTWYKEMEVDQLSIEEAGVIANDFVKFAFDKQLLNEQESKDIKRDLEEYFKKELVVVRTLEELSSASTQTKWLEGGYQIFKKYIGTERADHIAMIYMEEQACKTENDSCCDTKKDIGLDRIKEDCCKKK